MERLTHNTTYYVGEFILRVSENGTLRVTTDRGKVLICPKADNAVELKSSRGTFVRP